MRKKATHHEFLYNLWLVFNNPVKKYFTNLISGSTVLKCQSEFSSLFRGYINRALDRGKYEELSPQGNIISPTKRL